jgi:hypothetical protein
MKPLPHAPPAVNLDTKPDTQIHTRTAKVLEFFLFTEWTGQWTAPEPGSSDLDLETQ